MPTGFTAAVMDGRITGFNEFALQCARGMGACISMRDDPWDAPIPEKFEPSDYSAKKLSEAEDALARLRAMRPDEVEDACNAHYEKRVSDRQESRARAQLQNDRLDAMERAVLDWMPPTANHVEMKVFMLDQIRISRHDIGYYDRLDPIERLSPEDWYRQQLDAAHKDIGYHAGEHAKEVNRAAGRTLWIKQLRSSLEG